MTVIQRYHDQLKLVFFQPSYRAALERFQLSKDQMKFTALPSKALSICSQDSYRHPVVILKGDRPVGFFVLHEGEDMHTYSMHNQSMLIRALSINHKDQGKGYASESMGKLPEFVKSNFAHINELFLVVNNRNIEAQHVYKKAGFRDKGLRRVGRSGPQMVLHFDLNDR